MISLLLLLSLVATMSVFARMAGGGIWPKRPANLAEFIFAIPFAFSHIAAGDAWWIPALCVVWSFIWFSTGHATAFHMGADVNYAAGGRREPLDIIVDPICRLFGLSLGGEPYCWIFMALKGVLIFLPLGWLSLFAITWWPLCYFVGNRIVPRVWPTIDGEMVAELMSGGVAGAVVWTSLILY